MKDTMFSEPLNKQCICGEWLNNKNAKFIGIMTDLEIWSCQACGATNGKKVSEKPLTEEELSAMENDLIRRGFFNEASQIASQVKRVKDD